ncbi:MAG: DUF1134 domain-containing protein [Alphaproteobacteria bacterium]|nr:DUF1134 domain-containing protein [Alphaproteobacteria bacterium]
MARRHFASLHVGLFLAAFLLLGMPFSAHAQQNQPGTIEDFSENSLIIASAKYLGATAESMAEIIDRIFSRYGTPSAVIRGEEISVSVMFGARYGRGTLLFPDGREVPIYWRGPSAGIDMGAAGNKSFALVYNIDNPEDLYRRFAGVDGSFVALGGVGLNYLQRGNTIIAPMRIGVGYQIGVSLGYLKFADQPGWLPF